MALTAQPYFAGLLGDDEVAALLDSGTDIAAMLRFEKALARAEVQAGLIESEAAEAVIAAIGGFEPDMRRLAAATLRDGVPVPDLVNQLRETIGEKWGRALHFGATTQDVVDTAMALKLAPVFALIEKRLGVVDDVLAGLLDRFGAEPLMAYSRMQAAIMITAGDRISVWRNSVARVAEGLSRQKQQMLVLSLAGAAGTAEKFEDRIGAVRNAMAGELGLSVPDYVPHTDRGRIADFGSFLSRITGALGKIGQDVALMVQNGIDQVEISGGGGSSAMPHKHNPVLAEVLVALARYNATQVSGVHQALVHEQERSGSAWTLEWLILPQMIEAAALSLAHGAAMLTSIERFGERR